MDLYTQHQRPVPLEVESKGGPDLFACASEDKASITLFAVNSQATPVPLRIAAAGFGKSLYLRGAQTVCDTQDARQIDP